MSLYATRKYEEYMQKFDPNTPTLVTWKERRGNLTLIGSIQSGDLEVDQQNPLSIKLTPKGEQTLKEVIITSASLLQGD